jgi:hypothetical protein
MDNRNHNRLSGSHYLFSGRLLLKSGKIICGYYGYLFVSRLDTYTWFGALMPFQALSCELCATS